MKLAAVLLLAMTGAVWSAQTTFYPSSSVPAPGLPYSVETGPLLKNKNAKEILRVKVFPHDLKNDWVHGRPDNPKKVSLKAKKAFLINGFYAHSARVELSTPSALKITLDNGQVFETKRALAGSRRPVQILRQGNEDKSHSYRGKLEVFAQDSKIIIINHIDIESYLRGVVPKESVSSWPLEALKAQAVAARTYAYYHLLTSTGKRYDADDTARYQVYAGESAAAAATNLAVRQTRGQVLTNDNKVVVAFFHAYSGGRTDSALNIFGQEAQHCQGVKEQFTRKELKELLPASARWIVEWTTDWTDKKELMQKLKNSSPKFADFYAGREFQVDQSAFNPKFNSVKTLLFSQNGLQASLNFVKIRTYLGWSNFPAYHFRLLKKREGKDQSEEVAFKGHGWGHHVGMSQWGAYMMARAGKSYQDILFHYYSNVELSRF